MLGFSVKTDRCGGCGLCVKDCPPGIIQLNDNKLPFIPQDKEGSCVRCQHCLAVCPNGAISVLGCEPDESLPITPDAWPKPELMTRLIRGRRSIRHYRDINVDRELISQLLATVAHAPTGTNSCMLTFSVIDDKDSLDRFRTKVMHNLAKTIEAGQLPERLTFLQSAASNYFKNHTDRIFRGAPHLLIVSSAPEASTAAEDVIIALSYFELLSQSNGIGTVWCGMLKWVLELMPDLKQLIELPQGHPYYAMLFGYPAISYARTVQRDNAAVMKTLRFPGDE